MGVQGFQRTTSAGRPSRYSSWSVVRVTAKLFGLPEGAAAAGAALTKLAATARATVGLLIRRVCLGEPVDLLTLLGTPVLRPGDPYE